MAVHLPLSVEAQAECRFLLLSPNNLLKPSDGGPVAVPSQDMVLGIYYLTMDEGNKNEPRADISKEELSKAVAAGEIKVFKSENEAILAYENKVVSLHQSIKVRRKGVDRDGN